MVKIISMMCREKYTDYTQRFYFTQRKAENLKQNSCNSRVAMEKNPTKRIDVYMKDTSTNPSFKSQKELVNIFNLKYIHLVSSWIEVEFVCLFVWLVS